MKINYISIVLVLFLLPIIAGCSSKGNLSGLSRCEGTVTHNGTPVAGASVTFYPDGESNARSAGGVTDAAGLFKTTTLKPEDGIMQGNYKVAIVKYEEYGPPAKMVPNEDGEMVSGGRLVKNVLPEKYAKPETSGLTVSITRGKQTVSFDLKD